MKEKLTNNKIQGQSVLEVLVALAILATGILGGFFLAYQSQLFSIDTEFSQKAIYLAHQESENLRLLAKTNFSGLVSSSSTFEKFLRETVISDIDTYTKKAISRVSWTINPLRPQKIELTTILTDWKNISAAGAAGGGSGGSSPTGDWQNPTTLGNVDLGPGNEGTDIEVRGLKVYMTSAASDVNKPDLFIFDVSNPASPQLLSQTNFGVKGFNSLSVGGTYLYAVSSDDNNEFFIIDISNSAAPIIKSSLNLEGSADGLSVFYKNDFVYAGRKNGAPNEFVIINVADKLNPQYLSGLTGVGGEINDIFVFNNRAYLGTEDDSNSLVIIDVNNSVNPFQVGSLNLGEDVYGIFVKDESLVYIGGKTKFYIVDAVNLSNIIVRGLISIGGKTQDVATAGALAFLATTNSTKEFQVINISTSTNPTLYSYYNFPQVATGIDYLNNLVYVSVRSNDALRIITSSP